jgi:hypothetical protein
VSDETAPDSQMITRSIQSLAPLSDRAEILFRQVHPDLYDGEQPASSAFLPNHGDEGQLSTDRSSMTSPKDAHDLYVGNNRKSVGTFGVTVGEFGEQGLSCFPDPVGPTEITKANPAHATVDFSALGTSQQKKMAKR